MTPFVLIMDMISFAAGTAALLLAALAYARTGQASFKRYAELEALLLLNTGLNMVAALLYDPGQAPLGLRLTWYLAIYALSAVEHYCLTAFLVTVSGRAFRGSLARYCALVSLVIALAAIPGCFYLPRDKAFDVMDAGLSFVVNPLFVGNIALIGILSLRFARRAGKSLPKKIIRGYLILLAFAASFVILDTVFLDLFDIDLFGFFNSLYDLMYLVWNLLGLVFFLNAASAYARGLAYPSVIPTQDPAPVALSFSRYAKSGTTAEEAASILLKVKAAMEGGRPYLNVDFNLEKLASLCQVSRARVSQALNQCGPGGFYGLVNSYRLADAKRLLSDPDCGLNALEIAMEVGYSSKATFYKAFGESEGMSPIDYRNASRNRSAG